MRQLLLDFTRAPQPTFDNFVRGANAELVHALEAAVRGESVERVIYMWGESGAGKTHLARAFAAAAAPRGARCVPGAEFQAADARGVLAIDDIEAMPEPQQIALFNAFNEHAFQALVVAARAAPRDVSLRRDLATRLATGLTYRVAVLSDEQKHAALKAHAQVRGLRMGEDVTSYLLTHARRDMGSLIAALDSLDRYSLETGRPITVPLLKEALQ